MLIEKKGMTTSQVWKAANSTSRVLSSIKTNKNNQPKKKTVIAFALALKLSLQETQELLATAGFALNDCFEFDAVIIDFIRRGIYDIVEVINEELLSRNLELLESKSRKC